MLIMMTVMMRFVSILKMIMMTDDCRDDIDGDDRDDDDIDEGD